MRRKGEGLSILFGHAEGYCSLHLAKASRWIAQVVSANEILCRRAAWAFSLACCFCAASTLEGEGPNESRRPSFFLFENRAPVGHVPTTAQSNECLTFYEKGKKNKIPFSSLPELTGVPFADQEGIVVDYRTVGMTHVDQPYNPSIAALPNGYLIAFRNDKGRGLKRKSSLAVAKLDGGFRPRSKTVLLRSSHAIAEDPRCIFVDEKLYLLYSHVLVWDPYTTCMALARLDPATLSLSEEKDILYHPQRIEKNWVPFVYSDWSGADLYFVYSANPYTIVRLARKNDGAVEEPFPQGKTKSLAWESRWGKICGGTPALEVNGEFLTFFHSSFRSEGIKWYVMGAYTFSNKPPFEMKRISRYPIIFKKMYHTHYHPDVWFHPRQEFRVVFPGGFVRRLEGGRDVIHLAYGENDSGLCVLTLDTARFLASLQPIENI